MMADFGDIMKQLGPDVQNMINACNEMKIGSEPDESADYWEEKKKIDEWLSDLKKLQQDIAKLERFLDSKKSEIDSLMAQSKSGEIEAL
jgi:SMC interacting uncharacterized protein involved in chromosome segregation